MSGGAFDYNQYKLEYIADEIEHLIITNDSTELNQWGDPKGRGYNEKTIVEFKNAINLLRLAKMYAQRVDWLVSGDDGEEQFHERLRKELQEYYDERRIKAGAEIHAGDGGYSVGNQEDYEAFVSIRNKSLDGLHRESN